MARKYRQGKYKPKNPHKNINREKEIRYLSGLELSIFQWLDGNKNIIKWGAEVIVVPYFDPVRDKKRRYIVDLYIEYVDKRGDTHKALCEVKPYAQTQPVKNVSGRKKQSTLLEEQATWITNNAKWDAAQKYAEDRGWRWMILTEKEIYG